MLKVRVEGVGELRKNLDNGEERARLTRSALQLGALLIERGAKQRAPIAHGQLKGSIHAQPMGPTSFEVGPSMYYGKFQEWGTGRAGAASGLAPLGDYRYGPSKGHRAHPYLVPAFWEALPRIENELKKLGAKLVQSMAKGNRS